MFIGPGGADIDSSRRPLVISGVFPYQISLFGILPTVSNLLAHLAFAAAAILALDSALNVRFFFAD